MSSSAVRNVMRQLALVLNLRAAKMVGSTVAQTLPVGADRLIEGSRRDVCH